MTSKIKVDNINKVSDDSNIIKKCGTTTTIGSGASNPIVVDGSAVTLGRCGGTVALASGASQTGFGRSGSVNWQTTPKTATFTAADGEGYFINQSSGITANLPAGSAGAIVAFSDYARNFNTHNFTISPNGSEKIGGVSENLTLDVNGQGLTLVYVDSTKGWVNVQNSEDTEIGAAAAYIVATGGTITTVDTNFKVHTFTGPGTFTVCSVGNAAGSNTVSYLVLAGGAGGGSGNGGGGGGGAGGYREGRTPQCSSWTASPIACTSGSNNGLPVSVQGYSIVVGSGGGGAPGSTGVDGGNGNLSSFSSISSAGGGGGSGLLPATADAGGSGGGGGGPGDSILQQGGIGNTPSVSPAQGNNGGTAGSPAGSNNQGGGGGGAGGVGENALPEGPGGAGSTPASFSGNGGLGVTSCITASPVGRAGGGGANNERDPSLGAGKGGLGPQPGPNRNTTPGAGGIGNFGAANGSLGAGFPTNNTNGTVNLGGGGGGVDHPQTGNAGSGGSGIVIIRYRFQ